MAQFLRDMSEHKIENYYLVAAWIMPSVLKPHSLIVLYNQTNKTFCSFGKMGKRKPVPLCKTAASIVSPDPMLQKNMAVAP